MFFALLCAGLALFFYPAWLLILVAAPGGLYLAGLMRPDQDREQGAQNARAVGVVRFAGALIALGLFAAWFALLLPGAGTAPPLLPGDAPRDAEPVLAAIADVSAHPIAAPLACACAVLATATIFAALHARRRGGSDS